MMKSNLAVAIMGYFAKAVPLPQMSPLAAVLAQHKGGQVSTARRMYNKPNKWDVMRTYGNTALCRNRTTGEVAMKNIKLGPCAERDREINLMFKQQKQLETVNV